MDKVIEQHECDHHGVVDHTCFRVMGKTVRQCHLCRAERETYELDRAEEQRKISGQRIQIDEDKRRQAEIEHCIKVSGVSKRFQDCTLDNYVAETAEQKKALGACRSFVNGFDGFRDRGFSMFMLGNYGNGKTHLACAMVNALARQGYLAHIRTVHHIIRAIRSTWQKNSQRTEQELMDYIADLDLLVIDEAGLQYGSDAERISLSEVINIRYENMRPTIIISNHSYDELSEVLGQRIMDRMLQNGSVIGFTWDSYRGKA